MESFLNELERAKREIIDLRGEAQGWVSLSVSQMLRLEGESTQWEVGVAWERQDTSLPLAARLFRQFLIDLAGGAG